MPKPVDDERLLAVAGSISDGMPVDWNEVRQRFADSDTTAIVDELRVLHGLASVHLEPTAWGPLHTFDAIGHGSFATVYRAFDTDLQREIALKITVPQESAGSDPQGVVREARLLARVRHPNVVTVFGAQRRNEAVALAMELIKGRTLEDLVRDHGPFSARETTLIGLDLCRALAAVHEAGLIHGDIKAHNVMREEGGRIVLMDFGTGKDLQTPPAPTGDFAGTPLYLAPEVFEGRPRTPASDIYSLGILLFYLSTGTYPVSGDTRTEINRRHLHPASRRRLRDVRPDLPGAFVTVVERAVAEDPGQRYQTAGEFEAALSQQIETKPQYAGSTIAAVVLVAVGLTGAGLYFGSKGQRSPNPIANADGAATPTATPLPTAAPASVADTFYRIDAGMYRVRGGQPSRLRPSDRIAPGDELFLQVETSAPTYIYVVNEDDRGTALVMYPLPGQRNEALPAGGTHRLPGSVAGEAYNWQVTTPGEREHFVIFCSPQRLPDVERLVASLPAPREGEPVTYAPLTAEVMLNLRSVGGLVAAPKAKIEGQRLSERYTTPLSDGPEDARGLWVRQIAFENPAKK